MENKIEYLDLVDENDNIIGLMSRDEIYEEGLNNFRTINCFIVNSEGKLWIPRRNENKKLFPNGLDFSCGGHVEAGDGYLRTLRKEIGEELNIDLADFDYKVLGRCNPSNDKVSSFMEIYEINSNEVPNYNTDDFSDYKWLTPDELNDEIINGENVKSDLPKILNKYYLNENKGD